jgi:hypothetical protein
MRCLGVVLIVALATGCGGSGSDSSDRAAAPGAAAGGAAEPASGKTGCDLLTDAEVGEAIGTTIAGHEDAGLAGCRWRAEAGTQLMLDVYAGSSMVSSTCDAQKSLGTGREEAVPGLGDSAQWKTSGSLVACAPRAVIRFNLDNSTRTVPENKAGLITLARSVLGRL